MEQKKILELPKRKIDKLDKKTRINIERNLKEAWKFFKDGEEEIFWKFYTIYYSKIEDVDYLIECNKYLLRIISELSYKNNKDIIMEGKR